jgi:hypothetical protein
MPNFFLTGITTLPTTRAMFKTTPKPGKGADPAAKEESYMLSEGQRQGEVEVNHIDPVAKMVTVTYAGTVVTLDFTNNAAKLVPVGAPPPPGNGMVRGGPPGLAAHGAPAGRGGLRQPAGPGNTSRPIRSGGGLGVSGGGLGVSGGQPAVGAAPAAANQVAEEPPINVTREQQALLMEAQREMQQDNPAIPPLPPTSLTPLIEAERGGAAPGGPPMPMPTGPARPF